MTICLATLARDNAHCLPRLFNSVHDHVDTMLVVDTGSTDGTQDIARAHGAEVLEQPWVNFGHNRTELLRLARDRGDYILQMDADYELVVHAPLPELIDPCYFLTVDAGSFTHQMPHLLSSDVDWRYVGACHEYLTPTEREWLGEWSVIHHADGDPIGRAGRGYRELLLEALAADPTDARSCFYLAKTLRDEGEIELAIAYYRLRAAMGGWEEEAWYAAFEAARLSCDFDELLAVHRRRPERYEPLYALAQLATVLADQTPHPEGEQLFVHDRADTFIRPC